MQKALILEDNPEALAWIERRFKNVFPDASIVPAITIQQAQNSLSQHTFNMALIDLQLPDGSGLDVIKQINQTDPTLTCIVITIYDDDAHLFPALQAGAHGYLLKDMPSEQFESRLKLTASGEPALSPTIARKIIKHFERSHLSQPSHNLTNREQEVLIFIAKGLTSKEVASLLEISNYTVKEYIKNIYRKLNISSRSEATLEAIRFGLIHQF